jgi:hypothetical protein
VAELRDLVCGVQMQDQAILRDMRGGDSAGEWQVNPSQYEQGDG